MYQMVIVVIVSEYNRVESVLLHLLLSEVDGELQALQLHVVMIILAGWGLRVSVKYDGKLLGTKSPLQTAYTNVAAPVHIRGNNWE